MALNKRATTTTTTSSQHNDRRIVKEWERERERKKFNLRFLSLPQFITLYYAHIWHSFFFWVKLCSIHPTHVPKFLSKCLKIKIIMPSKESVIKVSFNGQFPASLFSTLPFVVIFDDDDATLKYVVVSYRVL